ncbi:MAG: hypothetical protein IJC30_02440 [Alphaproteobacteria bacterium]|nr:hypothetical protein [Alphaproteobacteria bacterium]
MWNNLVKRALLTSVCLTSFMWPYEAESAPRSYDNRRTARQTQRSRRQSGRTRNTPRTPAKPRRAEVRPEQKLAHFKRQISRTPNSKMTPEQKRLYIECLDMLASCPRGLWIIQNAPSDLKFEVGGANMGRYSNKTLYISADYFRQMQTQTPENKQLIKYATVATIAHEMTHAIQMKEGINETPGWELEESFRLLKLNELHAYLEEMTVSHQLNPKTDHFYGLVVEEKKKEGSTQEQAERYARTQFVKKYWEASPSTPLQVNGINIYLGQNTFRCWDGMYNNLSYWNAMNGYRPVPKRGIRPIVQKFVDLMGIDLKPEFFTDSQHSPFRISERRFITYMDGITHAEMEQLTIGTLSKAYINGQITNVRIMFPKENRVTNGTHRVDLEGDGYATYTVRNGKMNGPYRQYDAHGQQVLEIPMRDNKAQGVGWQRRDGKVHKVEFRNGSSEDYLRGRIRYSDKIRD